MSAEKYFSYFEGKSTLQQIQSTKMKVTGSEELSIIQAYIYNHITQIYRVSTSRDQANKPT